MRRKLVRFVQTTLVLAVMLFGYTAATDSAFDRWKSQFRELALTQGIRAQTLDIALRDLLPDKTVLRLDTHQPEFTKPVWEYLESAVSDDRVAAGQARLHEYAPLLERLYQQYGVQPEYLLAIWGMESDFGRNRGGRSIVRALATLAYAGTEERRDFWRQQLLAAMRILDKGDISMVSLRGSWAGAIGHTQFIPTTFERYAVDYDGDGRRDLVNSIPDALASTANYLAQSGWQSGRRWGIEASLPVNFAWEQADPDIWQPVSVWAAENGVVSASAQLTANDGDDNAFVLLPAGYRGPAFLAFQNFRVILKYNNAYSYALGVGHLGDRIRGETPLLGTWPDDEKPLSHTQKAELQQLLTTAGYSTDGVDGKLGPNTRAALRRWQMDSGFPADGYATLEHLEFLREEIRLNTPISPASKAPAPENRG
ncbi:MAG TPA: lytic murein transglycosylase [Candidatus Thiothrix moscowensis]|uniref:lytic murein transglycosylase n=1 Tax=unclassified Thiothrix TaxID=2636184 RepID=UPI0025D7AB4B|nr:MULTISPECIES: lytic murein transglycosylase [unclassified Thiothrix]HRJ53547.1 lytic murein transglycosylase [Candidatus Thiothrix moscowensis]HRJ93645.1 lytic murein transglycosylase [Candidatus Thiothrix moscowensis]